MTTGVRCCPCGHSGPRAPVRAARESARRSRPQPPDPDGTWLADGLGCAAAQWLADADGAGVAEPNAMVVATAARGLAGRPARCCARGDDRRHLVLHQPHLAKGRDLPTTPTPRRLPRGTFSTSRCRSAARREGAAEESAALLSRPAARLPARRVGVAAVPAVASRAPLSSRLAEVPRAVRRRTPVPLPPHWGGSGSSRRPPSSGRVAPRRLHDRLRVDPISPDVEPASP